tara:strand:+ start:421 stop:591 length:171 start_codon:yes stop_codon:yes gene_type:complete
MNLTEQLQTELELFVSESEKFDGGNKAAGTRARKHLMNIKNLAQDKRKEIQEKKNS